MTAVKGVIFDMDGVIIDSEPVHYKVGQLLFRELGIEIPDSMLSTFVGLSDRHTWSRIKASHRLRESVEYLVARDRSMYLEVLSELLRKHEIGPIAGVSDLIRNLCGNSIRLALASSSSLEVIQKVLSSFEISQYFTAIVSGDEVERGKPAPEIFLTSCEVLGLPVEDCVVIEDSRNGIEASVSAGIRCIGFRNRGSREQDLSKADAVIESFVGLDFALLDLLTNKCPGSDRVPG